MFVYKIEVNLIHTILKYGNMAFVTTLWIGNELMVLFLTPLAVGQRAYVMARCPLCVHPSVCGSVCALTFSLNIFCSETTYRILMKFHRNVPGMVLFRISWKNLIPSTTLVAMATKLKIFLKSLKIFLSETIMPRATKFGMYLYLMGLYQVSSNYSPGVKFDPTPGFTSFT